MMQPCTDFPIHSTSFDTIIMDYSYAYPQRILKYPTDQIRSDIFRFTELPSIIKTDITGGMNFTQ